MDVLVRQAHPGPGAEPYDTFEAKMRDGQRYQQEEGIAWPVLVDDLAGSTHQVYGGLADPTYLIDREGRVAFYNMWTYPPTLHEALEALQAQGGRGVVKGGIDHLPYMLPAVTEGWRGLRRGLPQSFLDLMTAAPGSAALVWLGYQFRPLLAPLTLRARPLPAPVKVGLALGTLYLLTRGFQRAMGLLSHGESNDRLR
ncbi:MAG: hypothetical protein M3220_03480 [Chloroflexota bacterium]|nr:hypothetical protein [Chloroflexota bacterium]